MRDRTGQNSKVLILFKSPLILFESLLTLLKRSYFVQTFREAQAATNPMAWVAGLRSAYLHLDLQLPGTAQ